ncbi:MAG: HK97 gp10 family phage protein [Clostridium sp.]|uniref:HK97 gp10 family phage protein n=1 Tax=Clostridium sp. TaxID=1506 RepID=UPI0025BC452E|nr:HK97 gp10 family phage protein [Clostridium sp.]MCF0149151.1 HK97 gp10 family phage protein [Clostridium sp.]
MRIEIDGMKELQKSIKKLGQVPQKYVTPSAKKGMTIALKSAKENAPYLTGELESGMKLIGEKSKSKGKKIYQVVFDRQKNDIFQKKNKEGKVIAYYPASQEFGWTANGKYTPGFHFLKRSLEENVGAISNKIVNEMSKKIDKALKAR